MDDIVHPRRILITGVAGAIGRAVGMHLRGRGHFVRGFDRVSGPPESAHELCQGNLADGAAVDRAMQTIDTVLHLGAYRNDADFLDVLLEPNVVGLYQVCRSARAHGVKRLVLASSIQAVAGFDQPTDPGPGAPITANDGPAPTNHYGLTKVWAEQMGEMYARCYKMSVISVRVGWYPRDAAMARRMHQGKRAADVYLSPNDARRFFACCVESPRPNAGESAVLFAVSRPANHSQFDLDEAARVIGYRPKDQWPAGVPAVF